MQALYSIKVVSTHSHLKVAEIAFALPLLYRKVSTHSHLKVADYCPIKLPLPLPVSTHSHLKVADSAEKFVCHDVLFQHTAT